MQLSSTRITQHARLLSRRCTGLAPVRQISPHGRPIKPHTVLPAHTDNNQPQAAAAAAADGAIVPQSPNGASLAVPGAKSGPAKVNVHFEVPEYVTSWGQVLKVVGSLEELGDWKVEQAPAMEWHEGHSWTLDVQLPVGAVNFKVVMQEQSGGVRWEQGSDRSLLIPETTSATGAPVGEVGVTCNFNDVNNSRVEVRPDRNYLKQQLKAVEARVMAIQEKKRKMDQRMAVLTEGLKKYDQTVALLEGGVQEAIEARQREKEAAAQQQHLQQAAATAAAAAAIPSNGSGGSGDSSQQPPKAVPAAAEAAPFAASTSTWSSPDSSSSSSSAASKGGVMVPIINPADLPSFDGLSYDLPSPSNSCFDEPASVAAATAAAAAAAGVSGTNDAVQDEDGSAALHLATPPQAGLAAALPDVSAIKQSHVNETVLSATVDQLLAAAEDALARSNSSGGSSTAGSSASSVMQGMKQGASGVDDSQLAEEYVEELLAAASALEQQADQRASLLLEAAKQAGNDVIAEDIQKLSSLPMPAIPTPDELAEAAAEAAAAEAAAMQLQAAAAASSREEATTVEELMGAAAAAAEGMPQQPPRPASPLPAATKVSTDGTITFSAESLSVDVDANELLAAVLSRIDVPLSALGKVTISATITPAARQPSPALKQQEQQQEQQQEHKEQQQQVVVVEGEQQEPEELGEQQEQQSELQAAGEAESGAEVEQTQQQLQQQQQPHGSPADAIAAVFSSTLSSSSSSDGEDSDGGARGNRWANSASNGNGSNGSSRGRYSKSSSSIPQDATAAPAAAAARAQFWDPQEVERQLATKEAARRAAAEKVASALAQVEEMRRSVIAANSLLAEQLRGSSGSNYSPIAPSFAAAPAAPTAAGAADAPNSVQGSSGTYSKYRIAFKDGKAVASPATGALEDMGGQAAAAAAADGPRSVPRTRSMPTVGAAAVVDGLAQQQEHRAGGEPSSSGARVEGVVKEELLALAALAASVQLFDAEHQQQQESQDEF